MNAQHFNSWRCSVAPMMDWTDRHCRYFHRLMTRHTLLYTEMVTAAAIVHSNNPDRFLAYSEAEHPVALQLGGSDPALLAHAIQIAAPYQYDEINLNVGCPSDRVKSGTFGACLMAMPETVAKCVRAMKAATDVPITVKCRLGIDDQNVEDTLPRFLETIIEAGVDGVILHARKAILGGLSPHQNRTIPPLNYALVQEMKQQFPHVPMSLNGGIVCLEAYGKWCGSDRLPPCGGAVMQAQRSMTEGGESSKHGVIPPTVSHSLDSSPARGEQSSFLNPAPRLNGIMIGRAAYQNPWILSQVDTEIFGAAANPIQTPHNLLAPMCAYAEAQLSQGETLHHIAKHLLGLFPGQPGARTFRRILTEESLVKGAGPEVLEKAWGVIASSSALQDS